MRKWQRRGTWSAVFLLTLGSLAGPARADGGPPAGADGPATAGKPAGADKAAADRPATDKPAADKAAASTDTAPSGAGGGAATGGLPSPLTPDAVLKYASEHRAEITSARAKAAAAAEVPKQVGALPDPMVMLSIDHLPVSLMGISASLVVQQDFPLSGVRGAKERVAEAGAKVSAAQVDQAKLDVEYQALGAYLMVVEAKRMAAVLDDQVSIAKQVLAVTKARLSAADPAGAEMLRAQLDVVRMEGERTAVDADLKSAASMLEAALGRPVKGEAPEVQLTLPSADPPALDELVKRAAEKRPELAAMKAGVAKANAGVDVMESMFSPMAFVRAGGAYDMSAGPGFMLMVGVSVPLWREKLSAGVSEAKSMATMADADVTAMSKMIEGEVGAARQAVIAARTRLSTVRDKVLPLSKSVLQLTIATYASGQVPLVSVLDAEKAVRDARMEEVIAEVKAAAAWARLGRAIGVVKVGV